MKKRERGERGPQRFGSITYPLLAEWTGLTVVTLRSYVHKGLFDPHDIESTLAWVNARRSQQGFPPIGNPSTEQTTEQKLPQTNVSTENDSEDTIIEMPTNSLYNPNTGEFHE